MYIDIPVHDNINNCVDKTARRSSNVVQATTLKPQNWNSYCCCCCWCWCKQSVPRSRRITSPTPHHSTVTGQMLFLMPNQQCQSTEGTNLKYVLKYVHETNALSHSNLSVARCKCTTQCLSGLRQAGKQRDISSWLLLLWFITPVGSTN